MAIFLYFRPVLATERNHLMNILSAILDAMISFIRNNPLTVVIIVMLAVFVPSLFGAVLIGLLVVLLLIVAWPVAMLLRLRREARRMERDGSARDFGREYRTRREYTSGRPPQQRPRRGRGQDICHLGTREACQIGCRRLRRVRGDNLRDRYQELNCLGAG